MKVLLHTIALEPARWEPLRVVCPLLELLPTIAGAGFRQLEVFEPHLALAPDQDSLERAFAGLGLEPVILSSYLDTNPAATPDAAFAEAIRQLEARVTRFDFRKVRLFPGPRINPADAAAVSAVTKRIATLAARMPQVELLLESHDGSIADIPAKLTQLVRDVAAPNVGILFQPTVFDQNSALRQLDMQLPYIRHLHLQNRAKNDLNRFVRLEQGVISWPEIVKAIKKSGMEVTASLEFIPSAICSVNAFDLDRSMAEAVEEVRYAEYL